MFIIFYCILNIPCLNKFNKFKFSRHRFLNNPNDTAYLAFLNYKLIVIEILRDKNKTIFRRIFLFF